MIAECKRCGAERDLEAALYCARCRPLKLAEFLRSNVLHIFRERPEADDA